jgi:hypothetical protein
MDLLIQYFSLVRYRENTPVKMDDSGYKIRFDWYCMFGDLCDLYR